MERGLNDLITVLGIFVVWQMFFSECKDLHQGSLAPLKVIRSTVLGSMVEVDTKQQKMQSFMKVMVLLASTVIPTYTNYVNAAAQHGQLPAQLYNLPQCFDT